MAATKTKFRDEDLFRNSTMTFGEHLEELRACLFKAIAGLVLAFILVLVMDWADGVVNVIQSPLKDALRRYYGAYSQKRLKQQLDEMAEEHIPTPNYHRLVDAVSRGEIVSSIQLMDVRETLLVIQQAHPRLVDDRVLEQVRAADFLDLQRFCRELYAQREQSDHPASFIWSRLSSAAQSHVTDYAKNGPAADPKKREEQEQELANELDDKVLKKNEFAQAHQAYFDAIESYDPGWWARFSDITGAVRERRNRAERVKQVRSELNSEKHRREMNRQLLAVAFPELIAAGPRRRSMLAIPFFIRVQDDPRTNLRSLNAQEMFMIWLKAALLLSLVIASPWVFYQVWSFVAAGLYPHEKRYVYIYIPFSIVLFLSGVGICFFFVFRFVLDFLFLFNDYMKVEPDVRISEWFGFALFLPLGFGVAFQLPLVMLFLERIGVMSVSTYLSKWRVSVLVIAVVSAVLTPADPYSIFLMAVPLVFLYFGGIAMCKYMPRGRNPFAETDEAT